MKELDCNELFHELTPDLSKRPILFLNFFFDINFKTNEKLDIKRISVIHSNIYKIENLDSFLKQFSFLMRNEKMQIPKEKICDGLENFFKSSPRTIIIEEFPNLLKMNKNTKLKYDCFQMLLQFVKSL